MAGPLALATQQGVKAKIKNYFLPITVTTKSLDDSAFSSELTGAISAASDRCHEKSDLHLKGL